MLDAAEYARLGAAFPFVHQTSADFAQALMHQVTLARIGGGSGVMSIGDRADAIPLLISGRVRVSMLGDSGREITLYRFTRGECCVLTADAILGRRPFPANAHVEEASEMALIPAAAFQDWLARYPAWRDFAFQAMSARLSSLLLTLEDVAFRRMDKRLAGLLLERGASTDQVSVTHQELANELGSSREVISRVLEDFQARCLVQLGRGAVSLLDRERLRQSTEVRLSYMQTQVPGRSYLQNGLAEGGAHGNRTVHGIAVGALGTRRCRRGADSRWARDGGGTGWLGDCSGWAAANHPGRDQRLHPGAAARSALQGIRPAEAVANCSATARCSR